MITPRQANAEAEGVMLSMYHRGRSKNQVEKNNCCVFISDAVH